MAKLKGRGEKNHVLSQVRVEESEFGTWLPHPRIRARHRWAVREGRSILKVRLGISKMSKQAPQRGREHVCSKPSL